MTAADYKTARKLIDTDYMAALAVIDTEYQAQRKPVDTDYRASFKTLDATMEFGGDDYFAKVVEITALHRELIDWLASGYAKNVQKVNRVYFVSVKALDTRYSN